MKKEFNIDLKFSFSPAKIFKALFMIALFFFLVAAVFSAYIAVNGRSIFLSQIEKSLGIKAEVSSLKVIFPGTIVAEDFALSDTLKAKRIEVTPSLIGFLSGHAVLNSIVIDSPRITIIRRPDDEFDFGLDLSKMPKGGKPAVIYINKTVLRNGRLQFIDKGLLGQKPFALNITDLNLNIFRPSALQLLRMQFNGSANLADESAAPIGSMALNGWVEPLDRNLDAILQVQNGKVAYFRPYYIKFFKKEFASGNANVVIDARSRKNDLVAKCQVALSNVAFKQEEPPQEGQAETQQDFNNIASMAFDSLLSSDKGTSFDFTVHTKLDRPKFENVEFSGNFFSNRIKATFKKPPQETIEDFKKMGEEFEAIGKQFKDMFKKKE